MKKIDHYKLSTGETYYDFHLNVLKNKRHTTTSSSASIDDKELIEKRSIDLKVAFYEYRWRFDNDSLECLRPIEKTEEEKNAFFKQYRYSMSCFEKLRIKLTTDKNGRANNKCPLCQMEYVGSLDHCVPRKPEFQEFSDHPLNLIPSCTSCNGKKGNRWKNYRGERCILNLYIDNIPNVQYLFVNISNNLDCDFYISNIDSKIDFDMYEKIKNDYIDKDNGLNLCYRYSENGGDFIDELIASLTDDELLDTSNNKVKTHYIDYAQKLQKKWGVNYWKAVILLAISNNNKIIEIMKSKRT